MTDSKLREALEPFARLADSVDAAALSYLGVGLAGLVGETALPVGGNAIRDKCSISVEALIAAREALATPPVVEGDWVREHVMEAIRNHRVGTNDRERMGDAAILESLLGTLDIIVAAAPSAPVVGEGEANPIDMLLYCPTCGLQHIDEPDDRTPGWVNPPHRSHLCHGCGTIWRPADVPTNGVVRIATIGKADTWGESNSAALATPPQSPPEPVDVGRAAIARQLYEWSPAILDASIGQDGPGSFAFATWDQVDDIVRDLFRERADAILALNPTGAK